MIAVTIASALTAILALVYILRMETLSIRMHELTFVLANLIGAVACIYSAYSLFAFGWDVLPILGPIGSALYLYRSRSAYREARAITQPGDLGLPELDYVSGGRK